MPDSQAIEASAPTSPLRAILSGVACILAGVALASLEFYLLQAFGFDLSALQFGLLLAANIVLVALIVLRFGRFERRWLAAGAAMGLAFVAGVFLLLQSLLPSSVELHTSLPGLPDVLEFRRTDAPPPNVPTAPKSSGPSSAPKGIQGTSTPADVPFRLPSWPSRNGKVAQIDSGPDLPTRPPLAPMSVPPAAAPASPPVASAPSVPPPVFTPLPSPGPAQATPGAPGFEPGKTPAIGKMAKAGAAGGFFADSTDPSIAMTKQKGQLGSLIDRDRLVASKPSSIDEPFRHGPGAPGPTPSGPTPPGPTAPGPTAPAAQAAPEPLTTSAYWNSWFVDGGGPASNILIAGNTYTFTLDVAAFDYASLRQSAQSSGTKVGKEFDDIIADPKVIETILNIKPMVPEGSGLRLADDKNSYLMTVDLRKLRQPNADAARQYAEGSITVDGLSRQASAGSVQIAFTAESKGCATIAFAVFKGLVPLDHLVQRVSIGETSTSAPVCDSANPAQANALSGGLNSLRKVSLGLEGSGASATAAAALHIFDFASYSMAVFVDGRPGKNQTVYGWQTASSVVDFLRQDQFQNLILKARSDSADKKPGSYVRAAQELSKVLFHTKPGHSTENNAKNALAAFRAVVREAPGSPVIVVRVASDAAGGQNRSIYVPLGILGAKGQGAVLERPIIVVQPMAIERYPSRDKCIGDWMFAVPHALEKVSGAIMPPNFFPAKIPGQRISDIDRLREYLAATASVATTGGVPFASMVTPAVGFVVLAHQDEGVMWFAESTNHIMPHDIEKTFPTGSVGIFAACSAASAKGRNAALLQRLNEQGIDTLIASPFTIDAGYGVVFASSFAEVVAGIASDQPPPTILELFDKTIARTAQKFKDRTDGEYGELGLEYVLLGNPAIRLCAPPPL